MRSAVLAVLAACAHSASPAPARDAPTDVPSDAERHYSIWLGGAQVGTAIETEVWSRAGVALRRTETLHFLRGNTPVTLTTAIAIDADLALAPTRVEWTETGATRRHGAAIRGRDGWQMHLTDEAATSRPRDAGIPADAIPAELVPLVIRRDGRFAGSVFLPARGFVVGRGRIEPVSPVRLVARLVVDAGPIVEATIDLAPDGAPARVVDGEGVIAMRETAAQAAAPFTPVDLIAATSVPLTGVASGRVELDGDLALPPVPGQAASPAAAGVTLALSATLPGALPPGEPGADRTAEITALVAAVRSRIAPDLGAGTASPRDPMGASAGDCTTFALAYAALAQRRSIPTRVVTGLRVDGARLVRHRWAVSWTGRAWIAVDAAFGAAPAGGDLIGLAIHDADDAGLIAGEAALAQVRSAAWL